MKPSELLELCTEFDAPDFAVFFSYSSHTKGITIDIYEHGWVSGQASDYAHTHYLDRSFNGTTQDAANWLRDIHEEFRSKAMRWTDEENLILKSNYGWVTASEIAKMLPSRTQYSIYHQARRLGLKSTLQRHKRNER